ncbi:MAG: hypothetical protein R2873_25220 [Caldilineaceae bacterium]
MSSPNAGFDGVELLIDHRWDTRHADYVKRLAKQYKQPVRAVHSPFIGNLRGWATDLVGGIRSRCRWPKNWTPAS